MQKRDLAQRLSVSNDCYQEQAEAYRDAAESARDSIQTYIPEILGAAADVVDAASDRDLQGIQSAADQMTSSGDEFMGVFWRR